MSLSVLLLLSSGSAAFLGVQIKGGNYTVTLDGKPWLRSGELRLFANGEWHSRTGGSSHKCDPVKQTDQTGGRPISTIGNTTDGSCCDACLENPACDAWVRMATPDPKNPHSPGTCWLIKGATGTKASSTRTVGFKHSLITGKLELAGESGPVSGADRFGSFAKTTLHWSATTSTGTVSTFDTAFRVYDGDDHSGTIVFEQSTPAGLKHTNYKNTSFADRGKPKVLPFLHFPSFDTTAPESVLSSGSSGYTTWQGTQISRGFLPLGRGPPTEKVLGLDSGPVVIFDGRGDELVQGNHALIVSPATHFKGAVQMRSGADWVAGVSGEVEEVPAGFTHETIVHASDSGVTHTIDSWGQAMRRAHNTSKAADKLVTHIGYWTDNGAFYYGDAYPQKQPGTDYNLSCCTEDKLLAARKGLLDDGIALQYLQLDDWWYHGPHPHKNFGGVKCVAEWELPRDTYPGGLANLSKLYKLPFLLYGPYFCAENQWNQTLVPAGADAGVPPAEESFAFYSKAFEWVLSHGGNAYEVDFMCDLYLGIPEFRRTLDSATVWQKGMNDAGKAKGVVTQFCMMHPSDLLNTLQFDYVTNGRASPDYASTSNWFIGGSSLLFWAVGMRPSKDNFWSGDGQQRQPGFKEPNPGHDGELNAILATMSTGPVGPADGAGQHNATRLKRTCAANGRILQTEKPLTPIDATFQAVLDGARAVPAAAVWGTYSGALKTKGAGGASSAAASGDASVDITTYHILGVDVNATKPEGFALLREDLYPPPPPSESFLVRDWHLSSACVHGQDAFTSGCIGAYVSPQAPVVYHMDSGMSWPFGTHTTQLLTATVASNGTWVLLGELGKFVTVSSARFRGLSITAAGLTVTVVGGPGEAVHVTALQPSGTPSGASWAVVTTDVLLGAEGRCTLTLTDTAGSCTVERLGGRAA
jgi:hypothetical protein